MAEQFSCIIHGSFSKHFDEIKKARQIFSDAGIMVLAPKVGEFTASQNGFTLFEDEAGHDPRLVELQYLHNLKQLGENGFSYFVDPEGYIGRSTAYELGIAQLTNTRCFFSNKLADHPAYTHSGSVWTAATLADYIQTKHRLPSPIIKRSEHQIHKLWEDLMVPGSVVATGAVIEHQARTMSRQDREILLVKTHKWGGRYSIVGGKVRRGERLQQALLREVREETMLHGVVGDHICTFDQIKNSGYYRAAVQHIFVDDIVTVKTKRVILNDEAQDYVWALPSEALLHLDIEPNARATIELYQRQLSARLRYT